MFKLDSLTRTDKIYYDIMGKSKFGNRGMGEPAGWMDELVFHLMCTAFNKHRELQKEIMDDRLTEMRFTRTFFHHLLF
jgi:hypothetical protein